MKVEIKKGVTSYILSVFISDSSSTTGAGLSGLVFDSAGLVAKYKRQGEAGWTTIALVTATEGTWTNKGFIEDDIVRGNYELHIPNAAIAAGAGVEWVRLHLYGATNMADLPIEIQLVNNTVKDIYDIVNNGTFGNAKLVRSATPANALAIDGSGQVTVGTIVAAAIDAILGRSISNLDGSGVFRSLFGAISKLTNRADTTTTANKLTIYKTNDTDVLATQTLTSDANAKPITGANTD